MPLKGSLDEIVAKLDMADVRRAVHTGAAICIMPPVTTCSRIIKIAHTITQYIVKIN